MLLIKLLSRLFRTAGGEVDAARVRHASKVTKLVTSMMIVVILGCTITASRAQESSITTTTNAAPTTRATPNIRERSRIGMTDDYTNPNANANANPDAQTFQPNIDDLVAFPINSEQSTSVSDSDSDSIFEVTPCSLSDPNQNECIRGLFNSILPKLSEGLPEYGMTSIDPYFYRRGIFRYANDGIQGGLLVRNMQINGISNIHVKSFLGNFTDSGLLVKLGLEAKEIKANGEFKADVKFGGLRLVPKGPFNITLSNIRCNMLTDGEFLIKDNGLRVQLHRLNASVMVGNAKIIANGIFTDRNLNNMILNLVNENLMEIIRVGVPATREQWAPILVEHINNYFSRIPLEKFLVL